GGVAGEEVGVFLAQSVLLDEAACAGTVRGGGCRRWARAGARAGAGVFAGRGLRTRRSGLLPPRRTSARRTGGRLPRPRPRPCPGPLRPRIAQRHHPIEDERARRGIPRVGKEVAEPL